MDWLSLVILVFVGLMGVSGLRKGLIRQILGLVGLIAAILLASKYYDVAADYILDYFAVPEGISTVLGFAAVALGVATLISVLGWIWGRLVKYSPVSVLDSLGGALFGLAKGVLFVAILLFVVYALPFEGLHIAIDNSSVAHEFMDLSPIVLKNLEDIFPEGIPYLTKRDETGPANKPRKGETV